MKDINTPLWQFTIGELLEFLNSNNYPINNTIINSSEKFEHKVTTEEKHVYGISGLANILGCSKNHAQKLKSTGLFDEAIFQNGRKIIIDKEKALELFNQKKQYL